MDNFFDRLPPLPTPDKLAPFPTPKLRINLFPAGQYGYGLNPNGYMRHDEKTTHEMITAESVNAQYDRMKRIEAKAGFVDEVPFITYDGKPLGEVFRKCVAQVSLAVDQVSHKAHKFATALNLL